MNNQSQVLVNNSNYQPTDEDRENDRRQEEWKERRREESRQMWLRSNRQSGMPLQHIG